MRHRGRKLAAVEVHGSARRVDASKNGVPFGHDECLSRNEPYCKGWCNIAHFKVIVAVTCQTHSCVRKVNVGIYRVEIGELHRSKL